MIGASVLLAQVAQTADECDLFDIACRTAGDAEAGAVGPLGGDRIREMFTSMASGVLEWAATWWSEVPALSTTDDFAGRIRWYTLALSAALLMLGMVIQGARMIWMRRAAPLVDAVTGLSTYVLVVGLAVPVTAGALLAGDAFAAWILDQHVDQQVAAEVVVLLAETPELGVVVLLGLLAALAGVALAAAMMLREVAVLLLAATMPLAATGRLVPGLGDWLPSMIRLVAALTLWKPAAALLYAAGSRLMIEDEPRSLLVGVVTLVLTVAALPAMIRWFTPLATGATRTLTGGVGMGGSVRGGASLVAQGPTVQQQVARIERDFGSPAGRRVPPPGAGFGAAASRQPDPPPGIAGHRRRDGHGLDEQRSDRRDEDDALAGMSASHGDDDGDPAAPPLWGDNGRGRGSG